MPLTTLDPHSALVLIDLQQGIAGNDQAAPVVKRASALADAFRAAGLPVVLVNVDAGAPGRVERSLTRGELPENWAELLPGLGEGIRITKKTWGAFQNTDLDKILREKGVTEVVIGGISTSKGVESTARQAYENGYNVAIATDAVGDSDQQAHQNSLERIFPRLGETGTSEEIIALLPSNQE